MFKKMKLLSLLVFSVMVFGMIASRAALAETSAHQLQLSGGVGVFVGTEGLDASFDFSLEPEYFITEHGAISFRFDVTAGGLDSVHFGGRFRYYFDIPKHPKINLYVGAGMGGGVDFHGNGFGDVAIPVFGWQYDLTEHLKIGSDVSFDIIFNSDDVAFATRLMPAVLKWAF